MIIFIAGPVDYWWNENWLTPAHFDYMDWRTSVSKALVEAGHLVYRPHEAFKGAWHEGAQVVNDRAIEISDLLVNITPPGIPAYGTDAEIAYARSLNKPVFHAPPDDTSQIGHLIVRLEDPYGDVHRKSYSKKDDNQKLS
jgi:hypothetical protein